MLAFFFWIGLGLILLPLNAGVALSAFQPHSFEYQSEAASVQKNDNVSAGAFLESNIDRTHEMISNSILSTARWMDSFFYDERYAQEENKTRIKLRTSSFWKSGENGQIKFRADIRLLLPGFEDRLALAFAGDDQDEGIGLDAPDKVDLSSIKSTGREDNSISLRYFIETIERRNISVTLGLRYRNSMMVMFPELRWRETLSLDHWELSFVQKERWYTDIGWEVRTRFDFDRLLKRTYLFRTTLEGTWSEEEEPEKGYAYGLHFSFYQPLGAYYAITYEFKNIFQVKPTNRLEESVLAVRYRQRVWRDWLFFEVAPQLSFPRDEHFRGVPGVLVFLEALLGHYKTK